MTSHKSLYPEAHKPNCLGRTSLGDCKGCINQFFVALPDDPPPEELKAMSREELMAECVNLASVIADDMGTQAFEEKIEKLEKQAEILAKELSVTNQFRTVEGEAHDLQIELCAHAKARGDREHERFLESERSRHGLMDVNRNLTAQLSKAEAKVGRFTELLLTEAKKTQDLKCEVALRGTTIGGWEMRAKDLEGEVVKLNEQLGVFTRASGLRSDAQNAEVAKLEKSVKALSEEVVHVCALERKVQDLEQRCQEAEAGSTIPKLERDLKTIAELNAEKDARIVIQEESIQFLRGKVALRGTEIGGLEMRVKDLEGEVAALKEAEGHLQAVIGNKNAELSLSRSGRDEWKNRAEGAERRVAGLHELGQSASIALQEQAAEISGLREEEKQNPRRIAELHEMIDGLRGDLDDAETELRLIRDFVAAPRES